MSGGSSGFVKKPEQLAGLSERVFDTLARFTVFPWAILETQCKRLGRDPFSLSQADVAELAPRLADAVARFTDARKRKEVLAALEALA